MDLALLNRGLDDTTSVARMTAASRAFCCPIVLSMAAFNVASSTLGDNRTSASSSARGR
jgi:hypothetical protein